MRSGAWTIAAAMALAWPSLAAAQNSESRLREDSGKLVDALDACRGVAEPDKRLACFDANVGEIVAARARGELAVLDRNSVRQAKRSLFGFSLPRIRLFGGGDDDSIEEPEVKNIDSTLASASPMIGGKWQFRLADKSVWQSTQPASHLFPKNGDAVSIEAGLLGSYKAKIGSGRTIKVKRVE